MRIRIIKSGPAQSVERPFYKTRGRRFKSRWFFSLFFFITVILTSCKVDYKVFIIRNNIHVLIYLSRMKSCLWELSCYHYSLTQRPISHRIRIFLATLSMMHLQTQLINIKRRNRLRVYTVCEKAWVSIPGEHDVLKSLNWCSPLELRSHAQVRTHTPKQASAPTPYCHDTLRSTVIANTKVPSLTECIIYLMRIPNGPRFTKRSPQPRCCT